MNNVTLIGNLGADPEINSTKGGTRFARLRVATTERRGEESFTEWHTVVVWDSAVDAIDGLSKGDRVVVVGQLRTRSWEDKDGVKRYVTEINVGNAISAIAKLPGRQLDTKPDVKTSRSSKPSAPTRPAPQRAEPSLDLNDEIPF